MASRMWAVIAAAAGLVVVGVLSFAWAALMVVVDMLAIDPEDQVPFVYKAVPLAVGIAAFTTLYMIWVYRLVRGVKQGPPPITLDSGWPGGEPGRR